jgi:hypothetical protein
MEVTRVTRLGGATVAATVGVGQEEAEAVWTDT